MRERARAALLSILIMAFVVSVGKVLWSGVEYRTGAEVYAEAGVLAGLPDLSQLAALPVPTPVQTGNVGAQLEGGGEPAETVVYIDPYTDALRNMDFNALRDVNEDVLGWILIPGTNLSYPLVQGDDNSYYLNHTWRHGRNSVGAIFLEYSNSSSLADFNTIIYGHRMNNRSMFGILHYFKDYNYWSSHPCVYITDDSGTHRYEIFAAYEVSVQGDTYRLGFREDAAKQSFIDYCLEQSVIDTGIVPTVYDRILTLSTCTGNGHTTRWVVQAVQWGERPERGQSGGGSVPEEGSQEEVPETEVQQGGSAPVEEPAVLPEESMPPERGRGNRPV